MLTSHQWSLVAFTWGNFTVNAQDIHHWYEYEIINSRLRPYVPGANELNLEYTQELVQWGHSLINFCPWTQAMQEWSYIDKH